MNKIQKRFYVEVDNLKYLSDLGIDKEVTPSNVINAILRLFRTNKNLENQLDFTQVINKNFNK